MVSDPNSTSLSPLIGHRYNTKLSQSMHSLLSKLGSGNTESSKFVDNFYELIQARVNPSLESIWTYVSLTSRSQNDPLKDDPLDRISSTKDLFRLIQSCSASCDSSKSVAFLVPVVYEVHGVASELIGRKENPSSKRERKAVKEVRSLVDSILGYVSLCASNGISVEEGESGLVSGFSDLVRIWAGRSVAVESFLPLVSAEVCGRVCEEGCEVGYLAGVAIFESVMLKLCLSIKFGSSKEELVNELKTWAVGSITGFANFYFYEILMRMLLEKTLPLALLSSPEDEVLLKKVLYDAVILVEYSFLNPERTIHLPADRVRSLAVAKLLVIHEAVVYFRERGDQRKSISYINAFTNSQLALQMIKWIKNQYNSEENESKAHGSSPTALIKRLVDLHNRGVRVFDDDILRSRAELVHEEASNSDSKQGSSKSESLKIDDELLFFVDKKGAEVNLAVDEDEDEEEDEMVDNEAVAAALMAAAQSMKSAEDGGKKRTRGGKSAQKKRKKVNKS